jgi:DNA-binding response OmpR family regulator
VPCHAPLGTLLVREVLGEVVEKLAGFAAALRLRRRLRVLVVDDDRDTVLTLGILFRSEDVEVRMLQDAEEVLAVAEDFQPDVVLLDIRMPARNGFQVAEDLRKRFGRTHPKLIAVTAHSGLADKCQARVSGFDEYCVKPYDPQRLLQLVVSADVRVT